MFSGVGRDRDEVAVPEAGENEIFGSALSGENRLRARKCEVEENEKVPPRGRIQCLWRSGLVGFSREVDRVERENLLFFPVVENFEILDVEIPDRIARVVRHTNRDLDERRFRALLDRVVLPRSRAECDDQEQRSRNGNEDSREHATASPGAILFLIGP